MHKSAMFSQGTLDPVTFQVPPAGSPAHFPTREVHIPVGAVTLVGALTAPAQPLGLVLVADGQGSCRRPDSGQTVAAALHSIGLATLLFNLLALREEMAALDAGLDQDTATEQLGAEELARRTLAVAAWSQTLPDMAGLPIGLLGMGTGAAAALAAAACRPESVRAVVSLSGQTGSVQRLLPRVQAPTLLIAGAQDERAVILGRDAMGHLPGLRTLKIVGGASHLFYEVGVLETASRLARTWFQHFLLPAPPPIHR
jgi:putative phosphoribosyl transferase